MSLPTIVPRRDPVLTAFVTEYKNKEFVGDQIFPIVESDTRNFMYANLDKLNLFQSVDDTLAKNGEANEVGFSGSKATDRMLNFALKAVITKEDIEDEDFTNVAMDALTLIRSTLALRRELRQASLAFTALDNAGRSSDPGNWSDYSGAAVDVLDQVRTKANDALYPYTHIVAPKQVFVKLERHPKLLSMYFDGNSGNKILTPAQICELFGVPNILIPDGRLSTQRRPTGISGSLDNLSRIWGNHLFLLRVSDTVPNRTEPGFGYQFRRRWTKGKVGDNMQVRTWELPQNGIGGSYVVQQEYQAMDKALSPEMGWVFKNVLT